MSGHVLREERAGNLELWLSAFPEKGFWGKGGDQNQPRRCCRPPDAPASTAVLAESPGGGEKLSVLGGGR